MSGKNKSLEACRGLAAVGVTVFHAGIASAAFIGPMPQILRSLTDLGAYGVDFFFVLSGFIIATAHGRDRTGPLAFQNYAFRRFTRIYPAYWPIGLAMAVGYAVFPDVSAAPRQTGLTSSVFLVPGALPPALAVAWTLVHEVLFYTLFSARYVNAMVLVAIMGLWTAAIVYVWTQDLIPQPALQYVLSPLNLEFGVGIAVALACRAKFEPWLIVIGAVVAADLWFAGGLHTVAAVLSATAIYGLFHVEGRGKLSVPTWAVFAGAASYSVYLIHVPAMAVMARICQKTTVIGWEIGMPILIATAIGAGIAYHLWIEKPLLNWTRNRVGRPAIAS